ncbi:hypothetical protein Tco_1509910 [Tanacetum coccineum]
MYNKQYNNKSQQDDLLNEFEDISELDSDATRSSSWSDMNKDDEQDDTEDSDMDISDDGDNRDDDDDALGFGVFVYDMYPNTYIRILSIIV